MNIRILCVGNLREGYFKEAFAEYAKRLGRYCKLAVEEIRETNGEEESRQILARLSKGDITIALDGAGKAMSSQEFAAFMAECGVNGKSELTFVIGGSDGFGDEVKAQSDLVMSFSQMTFPHQMIRVFLAEQIYRSFKINRGEPYHK